MKLRKSASPILLCLALCFLCPLLLAACEPTLTPSAATGPAQVRFVVPGIYGFDRAFYAGLLPAFDAQHPQIAVELLSVPPQELASRSREGLVDVYLVLPFAGGPAAWGDPLPLADLMRVDPAFDRADVHPDALALFEREGTWAFPAGLAPVVMYYNRDLFDRYGVPYPQPGWTWDDFLRAAQALRDPDAGVYGYASLSPASEVLPVIYQHGGAVLDDWLRPTRPTFADPRAVEALSWYAALLHVHDVAPTAAQAEAFPGEGERFYRGVASGHVAMWMDPFMSREMAAEMRPGWPPNWGVAPLPRDARAVTQSLVVGYAISANTPHPEASWRWVRFLSEQGPPALVPPLRSAAASPAYAQRVGQDLAASAQAVLAGDLLPYAPDATWSAVLRPFWAAANRVVAGEANAQQALGQAQTQAEAALSSP